MDDERNHETTPQTEEALRPIVKTFALERGVTERFVYNILGGKALDEYHRFKHKLFRPALRSSLDSARVYVEDLTAEIDRAERVQFSTGIDHAIVIEALLNVVMADAKGSPKPERVQAMRHAHRTLGMYLRSIEFEEERGEVARPKAVNE